MVEALTLNNFDEKTREGVTLIDMYADWCGPCRAMTPVVEEFAVKNPYNVKVFKVDVDSEVQLSERFKISSIPCFIVLKEGTELDRVVGALPYKFFDEAVRKIITQK